MDGNGNILSKSKANKTKKNKNGKLSSGRNSISGINKANAVQTLDHRLVYLNPKERARRDLETRHGQNMV